MSAAKNRPSPSKSYIFWIAWRNLVARHKKSGLSFMTVVSVCGVAIGVAALIIVLSVMGGFEADLKNKMLRGQPHLEIMAENAAAGFSLREFPVEHFKKAFPEASEAEAFTQADVVMKQGKHLSAATLFGVDPTREGHLWGFNGAAVEGNMEDIGKLLPSAMDPSIRKPGLFLGVDLAVQLGADVGDEITVLSPQANVDTALSAGTVSRQYVVAGKFRTGLFNYDQRWAVTNLDEGRKFMPDYEPSMDADNYVSGVALNFRDPTTIETPVRRVFGAAYNGEALSISRFKGLVPLTWEKANKSLLFALKLEKFAMGSILMLIVIVAAFSISGTMMMTVFHRRGQVGLLRSLGMSRQDIARLYLSHGFTIGTVGIALGLATGLAVCALIKSFQLIPLPAGVYHLKALPCKWLWFDYGVICGAAWILSLLAATYPAMTAARQDPGAGLRYL
jgi:lipoprotein-releasing system permease protein